LPLPAGHGPASHLSGGDPTGRYLLGSSNDTSIYIWDNGKLIASRTLEGIDDSQLVDINSAGVAVGYSLDTTGTVPWLYRDNQFVRLPGGSAEPKSINENNVVVGMADSHPVIWRTPESQPEKLAMPAGYSANRVEISEEGLVVASAESFTRPPGPNRSFVWYPDGTFTELERPALSPDYIEWGATRIRGEWASGTAYLNFKYVALRWNLRTGKSEVLPELGGFPSHNEHGWIGAPNPSPVIRTGTGQLIPLPTNISGVVKDSGFEAVHVLSDNGRYAAGELAVGNSRDNDNVAVRWVCT
jgi:hypothetical protein